MSQPPEPAARRPTARLNALARLDYPDIEILVMDNNTPDPAVWRPLQQHYQRLGPRFRFFHTDDLPGFKAGALNALLEHTSPAAQVIAVLDADYQVYSNWLYELVPHFADAQIGFIQARQDCRDTSKSPFKGCCNAEYQGFFNVGMVIRNDHDAIIQHGTMILIRRTALDALRWPNWCICEDAELGLRLLEQGYQAGYQPASYGPGLSPDTSLDFKTQRYRWVYGALQILKHHAAALLTGKRSALTRAQRYHFLAA